MNINLHRQLSNYFLFIALVLISTAELLQAPPVNCNPIIEGLIDPETEIASSHVQGYGPSWFLRSKIINGKSMHQIELEFIRRVAEREESERNENEKKGKQESPRYYGTFSGEYRLLEPVFRKLRTIFGEDSVLMVIANDDARSIGTLHVDFSQIPPEYRTSIRMGLEDLGKDGPRVSIARLISGDAFFNPLTEYRRRMHANLEGRTEGWNNYRAWARSYVAGADSRALTFRREDGSIERHNRVIYRREDGMASVAENYDAEGKLVRREVLEVRIDGRTGDPYLISYGENIRETRRGLEWEREDSRTAERTQCLTCHMIRWPRNRISIQTNLQHAAHLNNSFTPNYYMQNPTFSIPQQIMQPRPTLPTISYP